MPSISLPTGEAVYLPAKNAATDLALESARRLVGRSRQLGALNSQWGRATILKIVAGSLATPALETMLRVFSADALRRESDAGETSAFRQTGRSALLLLTGAGASTPISSRRIRGDCGWRSAARAAPTGAA